MTRRAMSFDGEIATKSSTTSNDRMVGQGVDGKPTSKPIKVAAADVLLARKPFEFHIDAGIDASAFTNITDAFAGLGSAMQHVAPAMQSFADSLPALDAALCGGPLQTFPLQTFTAQRFRLLNEAVRDGDGSFTVSQQAISAFGLSVDDLDRWSDAHGYGHTINGHTINVPDASVTFRRRAHQSTSSIALAPENCTEFVPANSGLRRCKACNGAVADHSQQSIERWSRRVSAQGRRR